MQFISVNYLNRVYGLDLFRSISILMVVWGHGGLISGDLFTRLPSMPFIDAVDFFFVLSGFLIGSILIKMLQNGDEMNLYSLTNFWKRRWLRTLPTYYLILFINFLLVKYELINGDIQRFNYKFLFFFQNFSEGFVDFFWESWSLSIQEWFYIILPIFILGFSRFFSKKNTLRLTIIFLTLLPLIYRINISDMNVDQFWLDVNFRKVVLTRLDSIIYGVTAAYIKFLLSCFFSKKPKYHVCFGINDHLYQCIYP